ncbi:MAG: cytochrome c [Flavobacteriales bacterium]|nr:cytochrome c [Flavobacteriales bacterium]
MAIQRRLCSLWLVLIIAWGLASCDTPYADSVEQAKYLFRKNCSLCHGEDGKLGLANSSDLSKSTMSRKEVVAIIRNGKNDEPGKVMTPFKDVLSSQDIELLSNFVIGLRE